MVSALPIVYPASVARSSNLAAYSSMAGKWNFKVSILIPVCCYLAWSKKCSQKAAKNSVHV